MSLMKYCVGGKLSLSQITVPQCSALHDPEENESSSIKSVRTAVFIAELGVLRRQDLDQGPGYCVLMLSAYHVP